MQFHPHGPSKNHRDFYEFLFFIVRERRVKLPIQQIFQGVTTAPARDYVAEVILKTGKRKVYMPCVGRFGAAQAFVNHGGDKSEFKTSDISLFSSVLGYLADDSKSLNELNIRFHGEIIPRTDEELEIAAAVMLNIKYAQIKANSKYGMNIRKEILRNHNEYLDGIRKRIEKFLESMSGISYDAQDLWDVIHEAKDDEDACIFLNVPTYKGGYTKMFSDLQVTWDEPHVEEFDPKTYENMVKELTDAKCHALVYSQKSLDKIPESWQPIFAQDYGIDRTDFVVSNRPLDSCYAATNTKYGKAKIYEIYNDEDITEDTKIEFVQVDEATCMYYRDLFVHKLGTTKAESYWLMLIDGKVNTAMGLSMRDVFTQKSEYVGEVFGISRSSKKYKRLGKLFMMCLTSGDMKDLLTAKYNLGIRKIKGIKTSSLTTFAEGKTDRSVMKLTFREQLKNGTYRVIYQGDFRPDTFKDCVAKWLPKWGKVTR